jgi:hypothetical protein
MGRIDPMYQFSLDAYIELFIMSIEKSQRSSKLEERITNLNDYHTYAVYKSVSLELFVCVFCVYFCLLVCVCVCVCVCVADFIVKLDL